MKSKKITITDYVQGVDVNEEAFNRIYDNFTNLSGAFHKFKELEFILLDSKSDNIIEIYNSRLNNKIYPIIMSGVDFTDAKVYEQLPGALGSSEKLSVIVDSMVGNMTYHYITSSKKSTFILEYSAFALLFQRELMVKLYNKLYGRSETEAHDDITICVAYSLFKHIYGLSDSEAKLNTIDLLNQTEILNQSMYDSRISINVRINNMIQPNSRNLYDVLYYAGYFSDFLNYTEFYTNLAKAYGKETIKYLFNTITFSKDINSQAYFLNKIIVLSSSDLLHELEGYKKIKSSINESLRTVRKLTDNLLIDYAKFISSKK